MRIALLVAGMLCSQMAFSADWTDFLDKRFKYCIYTPENAEKSDEASMEYRLAFGETGLPLHLQKDVVGIDIGKDGEKTFYLKNATAYGYPITKIENTFSSLNNRDIITFKQVNFNKLKPRFRFKVNGRTVVAGKKTSFAIPRDNSWTDVYRSSNNKIDYDGIAMQSLIFNQKEKTLTCDDNSLPG